MPERGWYSLTVRKETAEKVREIAKNRDLTVDEFINELMRQTSKGFCSTCTVCGARGKDGNMARHMAKAHPKTIKL
ncbi:MAG: hypothetical protein V1924_08250 [Candidatus Bathyarchaeota archaeon]